MGNLGCLVHVNKPKNVANLFFIVQKNNLFVKSNFPSPPTRHYNLFVFLSQTRQTILNLHYLRTQPRARIRVFAACRNLWTTSWKLSCSQCELRPRQVLSARLRPLAIVTCLRLVSGMCGIEDRQNAHFLQLERLFQGCRLDMLVLSEVISWNFTEYSLPFCRPLPLYPGTPSGSRSDCC